MITRLYIDNFRCFEKFELRFGDRSSILLIGANGSGKSTIGSVLLMLRRIASGDHRVIDLIRRSDFRSPNRTTPIRFEIDVTVGEFSYSYSVAFALTNDTSEFIVADEALECDGKTLYSRSGGGRAHVSSSLVESQTSVNIDLRYVALPIIREDSLTDPLYVFRTWLSRTLVLAPEPQRILEDSAAESLTPDVNVANFGAWFTALVAQHPSAYTEFSQFVSNIMPDFSAIRNPLSPSGSRSLSVYFEQDNNSIETKFGCLSDGEKCFFICAAVVAANKAYGPLFCFWDEPDNYLSISEVGHFVTALRQSFRDGGQLIVTSHNPEAIRRFSEENTIAVGRINHMLPTIARPLSELNINGDLISALIRNDVSVEA